MDERFSSCKEWYGRKSERWLTASGVAWGLLFDYEKLRESRKSEQWSANGSIARAALEMLRSVFDQINFLVYGYHHYCSEAELNDCFFITENSVGGRIIVRTVN